MATTKTRSTTARSTTARTSTPEAASGDVAKPRLRAGTSRGKASPPPDAAASSRADAVVAMTPTEHIRLRAYYLSLERHGSGAGR